MRSIYLGLCIATAATLAIAQDFPNRPVRLVVPYPPSGNVDITARTVAPAFGEALGQQVIVENRAGAGGRIGTETVVRSPADGYTLLLGSKVESKMYQLTASIGHIKEGRIKPLAISSAQRSPLLPNVPAFDELGVKGYEADTFTGIFAPAGVPPAVQQKLSSSLRKAMAVESVRERYRTMGVELMDMSQPQFAAYVRADYQKWQKVAREGNISVE